ncbi:WD repeat-containing protein 34, partial [Dinochytrium kinnereticum]
MTNFNDRPKAAPVPGPAALHFADEAAGEITSIASTWKTKRSSQAQSCQTIPIKTDDVNTQTAKLRERECQTVAEPDKPFRLLSNINYDDLCCFLEKVEPMLSRELMRNARSSAFEGYDVRWDEEVSSITCLFSLENIQREMDMDCSDISWNKSGTIVGASYGRFDHAGWCTHKGYLCCWNIGLRDVNPSYPTFRMETPTCLMSLAFHPESPNLVAGGTFNGEVMVWSLNEKDDLVVAMSKMSEHTHQEPISKVSWIVGSKPGTYD